MINSPIRTMVFQGSKACFVQELHSDLKMVLAFFNAERLARHVDRGVFLE